MMTLVITYDETTGEVNVNGPINNKGLCYLMLGCARDAVKDHVENIQRQAKEVPIVPASTIPNGLDAFLGRRIKRKR